MYIRRPHCEWKRAATGCLIMAPLSYQSRRCPTWRRSQPQDEMMPSLTIAPQSFLTVNGTLTNNAGNAGLVIQSKRYGNRLADPTTPTM